MNEPNLLMEFALRLAGRLTRERYHVLLCEGVRTTGNNRLDSPVLLVTPRTGGRPTALIIVGSIRAKFDDPVELFIMASQNAGLMRVRTIVADPHELENELIHLGFVEPKQPRRKRQPV